MKKDEKKLVFDFKLEPKDFTETIVDVTFGMQRWKRYVIAVVWVFFAVLLILHLTHVITLTNVMYSCALLVTVIVGATFVTMIIGIFQYRTKYKKGINLKRRIEVDGEGFTFKNRSTEESGYNPWSDVMQIRELNDFYIIGINQRDTIILPKRAILTAKDKERFDALCEEKLKNRFRNC